MKNQFIDEIKQIEKIANSLHQEDLSNQASTNYEKTKLNNELNDLNRRHKDSLSAIHRINENFQQTKYKYQREIADKQKSVSFITTMENDLPHNLYEKFCPKRVTIPQRILLFCMKELPTTALLLLLKSCFTRADFTTLMRWSLIFLHFVRKLNSIFQSR